VNTWLYRSAEKEIVARRSLLYPHEQGEHAAEEQEEKRGRRVPQSYFRVIHGRPVSPSGRHTPGLQQPFFLVAP
jgi:hypothetical protein